MARKLSPGIHNIRIKKPGGGTRMQRVQVLKSGKFKCIKNVKGAVKSKPKATPRGKARGISPKKQGGTPRMAKRKMSLVNRVANLGLFILAFSPILLNLQATIARPERILDLYTAGLNRGKFDKQLAIRAYGPVAAAFILFEVKKMAMKKFRF